ncbi:tryptophan--tRNA ligase [Candidatus Vidania fulgoroideorum]
MKKIILTGDAPTGRLHLGHYFGSIKKRIELQKKYDQYIIIADNQAISNNIEISKLKENVINMVIEYLSLGISQKYTNIFLQSYVPEINELYVFLMNFINYPRLIRNPTIKYEMKKKNNYKVGFINYPISQSADILSFNSDFTIVGKDQKPIIEQCNFISNKINKIFNKNIFKKCNIIYGIKKKLVGVYGRNKMSKSLGNSINIQFSNDELKKIVNKIYTDPNRISSKSPGNLKGNVLFCYLKLFLKKKEYEDISYKYINGRISDCKSKVILLELLINFLEPINKKINFYKKNKDMILNILKKGIYNSRHVVINNLKRIKRLVGLDYIN